MWRIALGLYRPPILAACGCFSCGYMHPQSKLQEILLHRSLPYVYKVGPADVRHGKISEQMAPQPPAPSTMIVVLERR